MTAHPSDDRLARRFADLKAAGRGGLVVYVMAHDPDAATAQAILDGLPAAGADIIELGLPFSDPMADGPAIQLAGQRALAAGGSLKGALDALARFRETDSETPVILMGYYNPIYRMGPETFAARAAEAGADGLICVDLPPEEAAELADPLRAHGLHLIMLAAPTTDEARLPAVLRRASGFLYYVSITGITGTRSADAETVACAVERLKAAADLPVAVGFGIKTPEQAATMAGLADAAVVGSAVVSELAGSLDAEGRAGPHTVSRVHALVGRLAAGVRGDPPSGQS
ncbi:tryptophan synthase subunit alpha [Roseospirillum parvum]|uniref:Tryptophan synthase alpha chain n=1 Tax=Roseospirillum parvum TaxID=83401 RepID=A0A1G8EJ04_9PROT|nr:tryptophan synthase subunit alpha [Roseospirillum parvum]SDH69826.1 tryptophan synthase, alpha chain [Roseospirillum parvum]